jgi:23S rRNA (cytidine1920-2'-O)/16S rRNA (cytidine1409-2'-O)-methyltransferase
VRQLTSGETTSLARLDIELVRRGLVSSRTRAQRAIDASEVQVNGKTIVRAGELIGAGDLLTVSADPCPFVGRGGLKMEAALDAFHMDVRGAHCLDVGASTGGFTDCLLRRGAAMVIGVDVGHGQMDPRLRADPRVELREGVNARTLRLEDFGQPFDCIAVDLSFISLRLVLPALAPLVSQGGALICLIKPQFEVGRAGLGRGGIVRDENLKTAAIAGVRQAAAQVGLADCGLIDSPIVGGDGNHEYLGLFRGRDSVHP